LRLLKLGLLILGLLILGLLILGLLILGLLILGLLRLCPRFLPTTTTVRAFTFVMTTVTTKSHNFPLINKYVI
jgi:hypothetical protein